jgi:hypothetical protein
LAIMDLPVPGGPTMRILCLFIPNQNALILSGLKGVRGQKDKIVFVTEDSKFKPYPTRLGPLIECHASEVDSASGVVSRLNSPANDKKLQVREIVRQRSSSAASENETLTSCGERT